MKEGVVLKRNRRKNAKVCEENLGLKIVKSGVSHKMGEI